MRNNINGKRNGISKTINNIDQIGIRDKKNACLILAKR